MNENENELKLIRNILRLVSYREYVGKNPVGYWTYWGMDTEMDAEDIEKKSLREIKKYIKKTHKKEKEKIE